MFHLTDMQEHYPTEPTTSLSCWYAQRTGTDMHKECLISTYDALNEIYFDCDCVCHSSHTRNGDTHLGAGEDCIICWPDGSEANKSNPTPGQVVRYPGR